MRKWCLSGILIGCLLPVAAQQAALTEQELSVIENIKSQNSSSGQAATARPPADPMQVPPQAVHTNAKDNNIQLSEYAKQQAWEEQKTAEPTQAVDTDSENSEPEEEMTEKASKKCLTVAFIDIDVAFNEHPRTQAVKKQIDNKIKSKQREVQNSKDVIEALQAENRLLIKQLSQLKPFHQRIATQQLLSPKVPESADTLVLHNTLNRLIFSGCEVLSTSPLNTPAQLSDIMQRIEENQKIIAERSFFIDNYKYQTREEILKLEQEEVKAILQDIYTEIKSFAQKRNIGAVVRKDEILYGQKPVNVTNDFVNRLKKSKKYRRK